MPYKTTSCGKGRVKQTVRGKTTAKCTTKAKAKAQRRAIEARKRKKGTTK